MVLFSAALVVLSIGTSFAPATPPAALPNIVVILTDDEPLLDGRLMNLMPNAKSIWKDKGTTFSNFHLETPLCCPARAGFLTGQHTLNHGVTKNVASMFKPSMTLATQLHALGYWTMLAGKYLNGYEKIAPAVPAGWDRFSATVTPNELGNYYDYDIYNDGIATTEHHGGLELDYSTDVVAAKAVAQIQSAPSAQPIFAWITPTAPHVPLTPAPRYLSNKTCSTLPRWLPPNYSEADVSDKPNYVQQKKLLNGAGTNLAAICRTLLAVDDMVASVRDALTSAGRIDNTIFVYAGDNGWTYGEHRLVGKGWPYITETPFYMAWPAGLPSGPRTISARLQNIDFAPTICALVGCTLGPYPNGQATPDGLSFAGLLLGTQQQLTRDAVLEDYTASTPNWFSITTTAPDAVVASGPWHYVEYTSQTTGISKELYDVSNGPCHAWQIGSSGDPCELQNLLADPGWVTDPTHAAILSGLQARLAQLKVQKGTP